MDNIWQTLAISGPAALIKTSTWTYPLLETAHVIGLGLLFGSIFILDLRLLGLGRVLPLDALSHHILPSVWIGFSINAISRTLLFISDASEFSNNTAFRLKILLIVIAGLNAFLFHRRFYRTTLPTSGHPLPAASHMAAIVSVCLWIAVITAGRMIAYIE